MARIVGNLSLDGTTVTFQGQAANKTVLTAGTATGSATLLLPNVVASTNARLVQSVNSGVDTTKHVKFDTSAQTTGTTTTIASHAITLNRTLTLPNVDASDNILSRTSTDTVSNKGYVLPIVQDDSLGTNKVVLTALNATTARTLTLDPTEANRTIKLRGNLDVFGITTSAALVTTGGALTLGAHASGSTLNLSAGTLTISYTTGDTLTVPSGGGEVVTIAGTQTVTGTKTFQSFKLNNAARTITVQTDGSATDGAVLTLRPAAATVVLAIQHPNLLFSGTGDLEFSSAAGNRQVVIPTSFTTTDSITGLTSTQTLTNKTLTAPLITTNGSIDVTAAGTLSIGASMGANTLTLGGAASTVRVAGDFLVDGTTTTVSTANLAVEDKNISLNVGGVDATGQGAGLTVERTGTDGSIVYDSGLTSRWAVGDLLSESEILVAAGTQVITGTKTFSTLRAGSATTYVGFDTSGITTSNVKVLEFSGTNATYTFPTTTGAVLLTTNTQTVTAAKTFNTSTFKLRNSSDTFSYTFATSATLADRTVTVPLLTGNDTMVFETHAATLDNKELVQFGTSITDVAASGDVALPTSSILRLTSGTSLTGITGPATSGRWLVIINKTGGAVTVADQSSGGTEDIFTGTGAALQLGNNASLFLVYNQSNDRWHVVGGSGGGSWSQTAVKTAAYTAANNDEVPADTETTGAFDVTLPASPAAGYRVRVFDYAFTAGMRPIGVLRNGSPINRDTADFSINENGAAYEFVYVNSTLGWRTLRLG